MNCNIRRAKVVKILAYWTLPNWGNCKSVKIFYSRCKGSLHSELWSANVGLEELQSLVLVLDVWSSISCVLCPEHEIFERDIFDIAAIIIKIMTHTGSSQLARIPWSGLKYLTCHESRYSVSWNRDARPCSDSTRSTWADWTVCGQDGWTRWTESGHKGLPRPSALRRNTGGGSHRSWIRWWHRWRCHPHQSWWHGSWRTPSVLQPVGQFSAVQWRFGHR